MHVMQTAGLMNLCLALSFILTSFDRSENFRTFICFNFQILLKENSDLTPKTEYATPIGIYHCLEETKKHNFKTLFLMTHIWSKQSQKN